MDAASVRTLAVIVDEEAALHVDRPALIGEELALTYGELSALSLRYSRWAIGRNLRQGDRVGLIMDNGPHYVAIWLGLSRIGVVVALLNQQLVGGSLAHCVKTAALSDVIADEAHFGALEEALERTTSRRPVLHVHGFERANFDRIDVAVERLSSAPLGAGEGERPLLSDIGLLVYTSGTTGMSKAALVSHYRIVMWSEWFAGILDLRPDDRLYNCLPLCHSVGGVVGIGSALAAGASVVLRRSFSASRFWPDISESRATVFLYIGQLCRYLVGARAADAAPRHHLRLCFGNGLPADVWDSFVKTFAIPRIIEFYAATEGTFSLFNLEGKPGVIGRVPPFIAHRSPVAVVRFDFAAEVPVRGADGFCERCAHGEAGEALGQIAARPSQLATRFEGYTQPEETERKVLRDVFVKGDAWFRTGDLMKQDESGYFSFVDRIGETFRWKGENVSTSEVARVLCGAPGVTDACVYGVEIPSTDGRAGMAAIAVETGFDLVALRRHVWANLPAYARPVFLRLCESLSVTGTFKLRKLDYVHEAYDPSRSCDSLLVDDPRARAYRPLGKALYDDIAAGRYFGRPTI